MNSNGKCIFSCVNTPGCTNCSETQCFACNSSANFMLSGSVCACSAGYYLSAGICMPCNTSMPNCASCTNSTNCLACTSRFLLNSDNSSCISCSSIIAGCLDCTTSAQCTECSSTNYLLSGGSCVCVGSTYQAADGLCHSCHYSCLTCNGNASNNCLTCDSFSTSR